MDIPLLGFVGTEFPEMGGSTYSGDKAENSLENAERQSRDGYTVVGKYPRPVARMTGPFAAAAAVGDTDLSDRRELFVPCKIEKTATDQ